MNFETTSNGLDKISADGVVVFQFSDQNTRQFNQLDKIFNGSLSELVESEGFKAKAGETLTFQTNKKILAPRIYVLGLGKGLEFNQDELRKAVAVLASTINKKVSSLAFSFLDQSETKIDTSTQAHIVTEGILLGNYEFNKYKKTEENKKCLEVVIYSVDNKNTQIKVKEAIKMAQIYYEGTKLARDLVNEPASVVNPTFLAKVAQIISKKNPQIKVTIYDREEMEKMGMGAFLGIAQAADTAPKFIHLEYVPKNTNSKKRKLAIVGKGITFDSGGISIKPEEHMKDMKMDMAGAAAVLGVFSVISEIQPDFSVIGLIAATPNMISGKSLVPGDVLYSLSGKTIEVLNTDAEGRVTMTDAITYAIKKGATEIIDLATLTGAAMVALGDDITALFSNNDQLKNKVKEAAEKSGEKVWELPLDKDYKDLNKSEVADISNIPSTRYGGAITAALFLEEFVEGKPWVHLDIAGPAFAEKKFNLGPKGGTGVGVRTLLNLLKM